MEPHEKKVVQLFQQINTIRNEGQRKAKEKKKEKLKVHTKEKAQEQAKKHKKKQEEKKRFFSHKSWLEKKAAEGPRGRGGGKGSSKGKVDAGDF